MTVYARNCMNAESYYAGVRRDYVAELPANPRGRVLEVGCSNGGTGALALAEGKCGYYCGVEMSPLAAGKARTVLSEVACGDVEKIQLPWEPQTFDVLILSEVLEHLVDPWAALAKVRPLLRPGALVFASSPNVAHHRVIWMLVCGDWHTADAGVMDRTHLRWFTPRSYRALFASCGYVVDSVRALGPLSKKARAVSLLTAGRLHHLFVGQIDLRAHVQSYSR